MRNAGEGRDFWSRRRAAVEAEQWAEAEARAARERAEEEKRLAERPDEEILEELGLPEPEAMDSAEQVQDLLKAAVPQRLKTRALRRLWRLNPVLANLDGLVEYGEDYTDAATVVENLQTAYQVGKGMLKTLVSEEEAEAPATAAADLPEDAAPDTETPPADTIDTDMITDAPEERGGMHAAVAPCTADEPAAEERVHLPASTRRMRFRFDGAA